MAKMPTKTVLKQEIAECVACKRMLIGEIQVELDVEHMTARDDDKARFDIDGRITGMRIQHDCIKQTTRPLHERG